MQAVSKPYQILKRSATLTFAKSVLSTCRNTDYIYNLQGWMKGVNSTSLDETLDPGKDASTSLGNLNGNFAKDVYGFSLHYYQGDYLAINGTGQNHAASINSASHAALNAATNDLFNGNIRFMQTAVTNPDTRDAMPMLNVYQYDQLNRLLESRSYETGLANNIWNPVSYGNKYYNAFTYDPNGNILSQVRHNKDGNLWENLKYHYQYADQTNEIGLLRNRLYHINDTVGVVDIELSDLDDQGAFVPTALTMNTANNYSYDEEGRLIRDVQEGIEKIVWRVDGKVKSIERPSNSGKKNVSFDYDAMGNRIAKHVFDDNWMLEKSTYYVLDASGNQLSMYEHEVDQQDVNYTLTERNIYGSSRLGRNSHKIDLYTADAENPVNSVLGEKYYELSNHLGNVLAVISDIKYPVASGTTVDYFEVGLVSVSDYSPFGVQLDGRTQESDSYRYGFNGMEGDPEVKGQGNSYTTHFRQYDPRIARWTSLDPAMAKYPNQSPYVAFNNNPIYYIDPEGDDPPPYFSHTNLIRAGELNPFEVRSQIESDREAGGSFKYLENFWYMNQPAFNRMGDSDIFMLKRKGESEYYKAYFVPEIRTDENGKEYPDTKLGRYVLQPMTKIDDGGISTFSPVQDASTSGEPTGVALDVGAFIAGHRGSKQREFLINGILDTYKDLVELISESPNVNNNSFDIQSINITLNSNLDTEYKENMRNTINSTLGKNYKVSITEAPLGRFTVLDSDVNYTYERYEE